MATTKKDLVREIAQTYRLPQVEAKKTVQAFLDGMIDTMATEGRLELRDFGVFEVKLRAERKARNPKTGAEVTVPARKVVTFKPGKLLQQKVRGTEENGPISQNVPGDSPAPT